MVFLSNIFKNNMSNNNVSKFFVGQKIRSRLNGSLCSIKREIELNNIKHFEICIESDLSKREIILSEHALRSNYQV
tara:strand:+ start:395 stop:622 length:228 start_codon:yes stop_codon:yes gene_type:complete